MTAHRRRLAIVATHPIQYQIPWFQALAAHPELEVTVLYVFLPDDTQQGAEFGVAFQWDIPLLEGYRWQLLATRPGSDPLRGFRAARLSRPVAELRALKPDVVLLTGWHNLTLVQLLLACRWLGIPCCVRGDSNGLKPRPRWLRWLHRGFLMNYQSFLVVGEANRRFYRQNHVPGRKLFDCPHFVDNQRFFRQAHALLSERDAIRTRWQIPPGAICFCFAGKLIPKKRPLDLLEALDRVVMDAAAPRLHLLLVGTGELEAEIRDLVSRRNLPVHLAGFLNQSEIARAYVAADCLVLPSDYGETWGLVVNEAMACGRPALVSDRVGCGPDLVMENLTGAVFPFGDVAALASRLRELAADPRRLATMGEQARQRVLEHYAVANAVSGTLEAVHAMLEPAA